MSRMLTKTDETYRSWIQEIGKRFRRSQLKAAVKVNDEMLRFYWSLGRDMEIQKEAYAWGSHFYKQISDDLTKELPEVKSFSPRNLLYMHQFYRLFPDAQIPEKTITKQLVSQLPGIEIAQQSVSQNAATDEVFQIPWGHIIQILNRCSSDREKALFYVHKTLENNWSRAVLLNHQLKGEGDNPTLGLLICRAKDNVKARYASETSSQPMGISQYDIHQFLPENYRSSLPSIEEIEAELNPIGEEEQTL